MIVGHTGSIYKVRIRRCTWPTGGAVLAVAGRLTDTLAANCVAHRAQHSACGVALAWLTAQELKCSAQVVVVGGAVGAPWALDARLTGTLASSLITHAAATDCPSGVTLAGQAAQRVVTVQAVESIPAGIAPSPTHTGLTHALPSHRLTGAPRDSARGVAVAWLAGPSGAQSKGARRAGVTLKPPDSWPALALAQGGVAR